MKKFTKIILIITAIFMITGFGFLIAGSVTAGGIDVLAAQLRSGELNFGNWHFEDGVYYKGGFTVDVTDMASDTMHLLPAGTESSKNEFSENITKLEVDADIANIIIKTTDAAEVVVSLEEGYTKYYEAKIDGDTLYVSYDVVGHHFKQGPEIEIELPKDMVFDTINVDTDLGEVRLLKLRQSVGEVKVNSDLGNIRIEDCKMKGNAIVTAALGSITIDDTLFTNLDISADMGNVEFSGRIDGNITVRADMGNIEVELEGKEHDYNVELGSDMGEVKYKGEKQGGSYTCYQENAVGEIVLYCDMGSVELEFD